MSNSVVTDCPNCKTPLVDGECSECGFKNTVVLHKIQVDTDTVAKNVKEQLKKEENADKAMQLFLKLKQDYSAKYPEYAELFSSCESPAELYDVLEQAQTETKTEEKKTPHGKAPFLAPPTGEDSAQVLVENLYHKAYFDLKATEEEKAEAKKKLDSLWRSFETGKSMSQIREGRLNEIMKPISECPECHKTIPPLSKNNPVCPYCGYDVREKHAGRRGTSLAPHVGNVGGEIPI